MNILIIVFCSVLGGNLLGIALRATLYAFLGFSKL